MTDDMHDDGPAMRVHQAVVVIVVHDSSPLSRAGMGQCVLSNCAASELVASAVVLAAPPLAAVATASK